MQDLNNIKRNRIRKYCTAFLCLLSTIGFAQTTKQDSLWKASYPFLKLEANVLSNDSLALQKVYKKIQSLEDNSTGKLNILHIGDSHIQADFFSGKLRQNFQLSYGNAGRGLVVPYRIAKTNEPGTYRITGSTNFKNKKIVSRKDSIPVGVSGVTIETRDSLAIINLKTIDQPLLGYSFTKLSVLSQNGPNSMTVEVLDKNFCEIKGAQKINSGFDYSSKLTFDTAQNEIYLKCYNPDTLQKKLFQGYGFILENDSSGVLYHAVGVNGAEFKHYNESPLFYQQLPILDPDLIIISLGTNDAYMPKFDKESFEKNIDAMVKQLKEQMPDAELIFTTPADSYRKRKAKNPNMKTAGKIIMEYCNKNNIAYWNFYEIMGGYGSINKWFLKGLTSKDKLHFTRKGYELQGDLLFKAIENGLERFSKY